MNPDGPKSSHDQPEQRRRAFADAQAVTHQEHTAELVEAAVEAQKRGFAALMTGLDFVEKFDATDPVRASLIDGFKQRIVRLSAALGKAEGHPLSPVSEALNSPFSASSMGSSPTSQEPSPPSTALESGKRKRGRPEGSKNKPKLEPPQPGSKNRPKADQ